MFSTKAYTGLQAIKDPQDNGETHAKIDFCLFSCGLKGRPGRKGRPKSDQTKPEPATKPQTNCYRKELLALKFLKIRIAFCKGSYDNGEAVQKRV